MVKKLFVLGYVTLENAANVETAIKYNRKYFPTTSIIKSYNVCFMEEISMINELMI